jgi:hypothetical protein
MTRAVLLVVFAPVTYDREQLAGHCRAIALGFERHLGTTDVSPQTGWQLNP